MAAPDRTSGSSPVAPERRRPRRKVVRRASPSHVPNEAPSQWGRRLARAVGAHFGVTMSPNHAKNEGTFGNRDIVIKCAKSTTPPVSVLSSMLERLDDVWAVFILADGSAEVWTAPARVIRKHAHQTRGLKAAPRFEITRRRLSPHAKLVGVLPVAEVERCRIP